VEDALVARQKLGDQLDAQGRLVKASKEYERLAWLQYNGGYRPAPRYYRPSRSSSPLNWTGCGHAPRSLFRWEIFTRQWEAGG